MKNSIVLLAAAFLCLVAFPTKTVGKYWPNEGWPNPSEVSRNELVYLNTGHSFNYGDSKVWKCTYSNGSAPAISISPSTPFPSTPSTPSTPSAPSPSTPSTPSPSPSTPSNPSPKTSPPPPTPSPPPPAPKKSPPPPTPSLPPPTPKKSPSPPKPSLPPPTPKKSPPPPTPSLPPPTPKKSPSPPPSDDDSSSPSNPPPEHHHSHHHHYQNPWEHIDSCMRNMGPVGMCRMQMEVSFYTRLFRVSNYCCNLVVNMKNECDDVVWGFFNDPFFVPLVRYTCHAYATC